MPPTKSPNHSEEYQKLAEKVRAQAELTHKDAREALIEVADIWERMAVRVAERAGFLDVRVDDPRYVTLTSKGIEEARLSSVRRPYADGTPED